MPKRGREMLTLSLRTTIYQIAYICHHDNGRGALGGLRYSFIDIDASKEAEETTFLMCKLLVKNISYIMLFLSAKEWGYLNNYTLPCFGIIYGLLPYIPDAKI